MKRWWSCLELGPGVESVQLKTIMCSREHVAEVCLMKLVKFTIT